MHATPSPAPPSPDIRQCGINLDYWWPLAHEALIPKNGLKGQRLGPLELLVSRTPDGNFAVYEDACPHKRVRLSRFGAPGPGGLTCTYHGWQFDPTGGQCTSLGGMPGSPERFGLMAYPARRYGGWVWVWPGNPDIAPTTPMPVIAPAENPGRYYRVPMEGTVNCHFTVITENATDLFHATLHQAQQPWANPRLESLETGNRTVKARYAVDAPSPLARLFAGKGRKFVNVRYEYPYIHIYEEGGGFYLFVTYLPTDPQHTSVTATFFFPHLLGIEWLSTLLLPFVEPLMLTVLNHGTFRKVFTQDIRAVEEEQRAYALSGGDRGRDTNPVTHAVRKVVLRQTGERTPLAPEPLICRPGGPA